MQKQTAKAFVEVLQAYQFLAIIKSSKGEYHEIPCIDPADAVNRIRVFCLRNDLELTHLEVSQEARLANVMGEAEKGGVKVNGRAA